MSEEQKSPQQGQRQPQQEGQGRREEEKPEIQLQQIIREASGQQQQSPPPLQQPQQPSAIKKSLHYYKQQEKYNWRLSQLEPTSIIERLTVDTIPYSEELPFSHEIEIRITDTPIVNKHVGYTAQRKDKHGEGNFTRRYTEYIALRKKLVQLWPGIFIATLPNKALLISSEDTIRSRIKYITHFWRILSAYEPLYYSNEVLLFMGTEPNIEEALDKVEEPRTDEMLERYKCAFPPAYQHSQGEEFMVNFLVIQYKKKQAPIIFKEYEDYFGRKKVDLMEFKDALRRLADLKSKYVTAVAKLNQSILPEYQGVLFGWFNGGETKPQPAQSEQEKKPQQSQAQPKSLKVPPANAALYGSQAYQSRLQDTSLLTTGYNSSIWVLYDVVKFELKDIDAVLGAMEQVRYVQKELDYLTRTIAGNKEQIESLNNNKTTLRTFFMGGSEEEKKERLTNESQALEERVERMTDLYHMLLALLQEQLIRYHQERLEYYAKAVEKSLTDQLGISRTIMDFHIYEYQLFSKEWQRRVQEEISRRTSLVRQEKDQQ